MAGGVPLGVCRMGIDVCSGHPEGPTYYPPRPAITGSPNVFVNGFPAVRVTDQWAPHTNLIKVHSGVSVGGSATVFCNGVPLVRQTDQIDCSSIVMTGSVTVFAG